MRKKLLVSALCMTAAMASAAPLTPEAATIMMVGRLAGENGPAKVRAIQSGAPVLRFTRSVGNVPMVYVFASRQGGFMVLSADDTTVPLLGFSDSGTLPVSEADGLTFPTACATGSARLPSRWPLTPRMLPLQMCPFP